MGEGEIFYEKSPELYEARPKEPARTVQPGLPEPGEEAQEEWRPNPEYEDSPYYRKLFEKEFAELEQKEGKKESIFYEGRDPNTPVEIKNRMTGQTMLRLTGYSHAGGFRDALMQHQHELAFADIEADLSGSGSVFDEANFSHAQVKASFGGASLQQARFDDAELECNFDGAVLRGASFRGCDLSRCSFRGANLSMADLRGATLPGNEMMTGANMKNARVGDETTEV